LGVGVDLGDLEGGGEEEKSEDGEDGFHGEHFLL
jgi:hypothetical protein